MCPTHICNGKVLDLVQHLFLDLVQKDFQTVQVHGQAAQVPGQAAQVPGVNGAGSKTGAGPAPRIGLLRCSGGAGFGPKMEPAPFTQGTCAIRVLVGFFATPQPMYVQKNGNPVRWRCTYIRTFSQWKALLPMYVQKNGISARFRCTYISSRGAYATDNQIISTTDGYETHTRQLC